MLAESKGLAIYEYVINHQKLYMTVCICYKGLTILTPEKAGESSFLETLTSLKPDLCITAAYGNFLPSKFLAIPKFGTLNIHPSLLPKYRGAAPVPRCLENGDSKTGVCVLFTGASYILYY